MLFETIEKRIIEKFSDVIFKMKIDTSVGGVSFHSIDKNIRRGFGCAITNYHHFHICEGFNATIAFYDVENLISPVLVKNELLGNSVLKEKQSTIGLKIQNSIGIETPLSLTKIKITDESTLSEFIEIFKRVYDSEVTPFFSKWSDLSELKEFILNQTDDDILFSVLGSMMPFRKAAILRLCNSSTYQSYMDSFYNEQLDLYNKNPNDISNMRYYNAARELKEILNKTEPFNF